MVTVSEALAAVEARYPPGWAEPWDRVGLVVGEPDAPVRRALCVVDCVPETVERAVAGGADLIVAHHPLLLRGVSSVAATTYKGRLVHRMIRAGVALIVAHTNADVANPGVSDALARALGLGDVEPLRPATGAAEGGGRGHGRVGVLPAELTLSELTRHAATALPGTAGGVRAAGEPDRRVRTVAVCGGAGDEFLPDAAAAGADAFLTADLRHHPASEYVCQYTEAGGPALLDAAHWATEWPWLAALAGELAADLGLDAEVSDVVTDPWTRHAASRPAPPATR